MNKKLENTMSVQEYHNYRFKTLAVSHYERLIRSAEQAEDETQLTHLRAQLEKIEAGDFSVAKNLVFISAGSKIYYDEQKKKVILTQLTYTM